jgi:hypothetical protein
MAQGYVQNQFLTHYKQMIKSAKLRIAHKTKEFSSTT